MCACVHTHIHTNTHTYSFPGLYCNAHRPRAQSSAELKLLQFYQGFKKIKEAFITLCIETIYTKLKTVTHL